MSMYNSCFSEPKRSHAVPGDDQAAPAPVVDDQAAPAPVVDDQAAPAPVVDDQEGDFQAAPAPVVDPDEDEQWGQWTGDLTNWGRRAFFADRLKMNARISIYLDRYCR